MATRKIRAKKIESVKSLKKSLKKGSGTQFLQRVPGESSITVRFLSEPTEWIEYYEYYDAEAKQFLPEQEGQVLPNDENGEKVRSSKRYLANVVDTQDNRVVALVLPKSLASSLVKKYDKFGTLLDRDYELSREGSGFDTEYDAIPETPTKMNLERFEALDLWDLLEKQIPTDDEDLDDDDDDDEDDEDVRPVTKRRPGRKPGASSKTAAKKTAAKKGAAKKAGKKRLGK